MGHAGEGTAEFPFLLLEELKGVIITEGSASFIPQVTLSRHTWHFVFPGGSLPSFRPTTGHMIFFREQENRMYHKLKLCGSVHCWLLFGCLVKMGRLCNHPLLFALCPSSSLELVFLAKWNLPLTTRILFQTSWSPVWSLSALNSPHQIVRGAALVQLDGVVSYLHLHRHL